MLLLRALPVAACLTFAGFLIPAFAGNDPPAPAPTKLPLKRVVLYTAGVGYFHREGNINGNARVDVRVPEEDVNDLIKSLVSQDANGTARTVIYDNKAPAELVLKRFRSISPRTRASAICSCRFAGKRLKSPTKRAFSPWERS